MTYPTLTLNQLEKRLRQVVGQVAITLVTLTEPAVRRRDNPFERLVKRSEYSCIIGADYESSVNELRKAENRVADFEAKPRKWGTRVDGTPLIKHQGKTYLSTHIDRAVCSRYLCDGRTVPYQEVEPYLAKRVDSTESQGLSSPVTYRDFKLESITEIEFPDGERYVVSR